MVINVYIIIILQLFPMRSFSYLYIYTHIQASSLLKRFYGFVLKYTSIILVNVKPVLHWLDYQCLLIYKLHKITVLLVSARKILPFSILFWVLIQLFLVNYKLLTCIGGSWETCHFLKMLTMIKCWQWQKRSQCLFSGVMSWRSLGTQNKKEQAFPDFVQFSF